MRRFVEGVSRMFAGGRTPETSRIPESRSNTQNGFEQNVSMIFPETVRYELKYADGELSEQSIESMINQRMNNYAVYLLLKSLDQYPDRQKEVLLRILASEVQGYDADAVGSVLSDELRSIVSDAKKVKHKDGISPYNPTTDLSDTSLLRVKGKKLARYHLHYQYSMLQEEFERHTREISTSGKTPFCVAYASFLGLRAFSRQAIETQQPFGIIVPSWIEREGMSQCGYMITPTSDSVDVSFLSKQFDRSEFLDEKGKSRAVLFDDVLVTGDSAASLDTFWAGDGTIQPESTPQHSYLLRMNSQAQVDAKRNASSPK